MKSTRVIGIDPGSRLCGWGVVERAGGSIRHVDNGVISLAREPDLSRRLATLFERLDALILQYTPEVAAIETVFVNRNPQSALILGHARGVAMMCLARRDLLVREYTPQQVKKAVTGSGRAEKSQVQQMVSMRLELPDIPQADAADAVAVALCHAQHLSSAFANTVLPKVKKKGRRSQEAGLRALIATQEKRKGS